MAVNSYISNSKSMNKFIKFAGYLLTVAVLFFAIDFAAGYVFDHYFFLKNDAKLQYAFEGGSGEEIIILGSSRASHHYVPSVFEEEMGLSCYNYGMDGRNIFNHYVVASELFKNSILRPKLVIFDASHIDIVDAPGWNGEKLSNLFLLYKKDRNVREIVDNEDKVTGIVLRYCNMYRYNSLLISLFRTSFKSEQSENTLRGYLPLYTEWANDIETVTIDEPFKIYPPKEKYLRKLLSDCSEMGIKVFVIVSPYYELYSKPLGWIKDIEDICNDFNVFFLDYSQDSLFLEHKEWFNEPFHLNDQGAREFTSILVKELINSNNNN